MVELLQCLRACYPAESKQSKHGGTEVTEEVPYQTPCVGCKRIIKAPIDKGSLLVYSQCHPVYSNSIHAMLHTFAVSGYRSLEKNVLR